MKKFIGFTILFILFILPIKVNASDAKCVYPTSRGMLTVNITDNSFNIKMICINQDTKKEEECVVEIGENDVSAINFIDEDSEELYCRDWVSYMFTEGLTSKINFSFTKEYTNALAKKAELDGSKSHVNNTVSPDEPTNPTTPTSPEYKKTCSYGNNTLYINSDTNKLKVVLGVTKLKDIEYNLSSYPIEEVLFEAKSLNNTCPSKLCLVCNDIGDEYCVVATDNTKTAGADWTCITQKTYSDYNDYEEPDYNYVHKPVTCETFKDVLDPIWLAIRILSPIIVLILGAVDFMKMTTSGDEKDMKKYLSTFIKRLIILVVIFILPVIVNLIIGFTTFGNLTECL